MSEFNVAGPFQALVAGIAPGQHQVEPAWARTARILREKSGISAETAEANQQPRHTYWYHTGKARAYADAADIVERERRAEG